jgi:hypothetical protein
MGPAGTATGEIESWELLVQHLPPRWRELARETGAVRRLRGFRDVESVLRLLLLHVATGTSLRESTVYARQAGWADVSDVAALDRLRAAGEWFRQLATQLLELGPRGGADAGAIRMVDASMVKEPGKTGSQWRVHYSLSLRDLHCDQFELTAPRVGESLRWLRITPGDVIVGDRAYSTPPSIQYVSDRGGQVLVRMKRTTLPLLTPGGRVFRVLPALRRLRIGAPQAWPVVCPLPQGARVAGRVCALKKSQAAARRTLRALHHRAARKQQTVSAAAAEAARYVFVFTTVPSSTLSAAQAFELYRRRWQIELAFKRLKTLAHLGHVPKQDDAVARAWLYGKILVGLLVERLIRDASAFSPWGYRLR